MQIVNVSKKRVLSDQCRLADSFFKRLMGLLGRNSLQRGEGLLFDNCHGIHTVGMRFQIDVLFLDKDLRVMRIANHLRPFHIGPVVKNAVYVLELAAGVVDESHTEVGDQIQFRTGSESSSQSVGPDAHSSVATLGDNGRN